MEKILTNYIDDLTHSLNSLDKTLLIKFIQVLEKCRKEGRYIFVCGNGGSAGTVNHFVCDLGKNAIPIDGKRFKIISLCDNIETITAFGNDLGFENIFIERLYNLMSAGDLLLAVSASGNSPDILKAADYIHKHNGIVLSMTGYSGGKLQALSDFNININSNIIEQIEDIHLIMEHMIVYYYKQLKEMNITIDR